MSDLPSATQQGLSADLDALLTDLRDRLVTAACTLEANADNLLAGRDRVRGKAHGVRLALSYLDELLRGQQYQAISAALADVHIPGYEKTDHIGFHACADVGEVVISVNTYGPMAGAPSVQYFVPAVTK